MEKQMKRLFFIITIAFLLPILAQARKIPIAVKALPVNNTSSGLKLARQIEAQLSKFSQIQIVSYNTIYALEMEVITLSFTDRPIDVYTINWYVNWPRNPYFRREFLVSDVGYFGSMQTQRTAADIKQKTFKVLELYQDVLNRMIKYSEKE